MRSIFESPDPVLVEIGKDGVGTNAKSLHQIIFSKALNYLFRETVTDYF